VSPLIPAKKMCIRLGCDLSDTCAHFRRRESKAVHRDLLYGEPAGCLEYLQVTQQDGGLLSVAQSRQRAFRVLTLGKSRG